MCVTCLVSLFLWCSHLHPSLSFAKFTSFHQAIKAGSYKPKRSDDLVMFAKTIFEHLFPVQFATIRQKTAANVDELILFWEEWETLSLFAPFLAEVKRYDQQVDQADYRQGKHALMI